MRTRDAPNDKQAILAWTQRCPVCYCMWSVACFMIPITMWWNEYMKRRKVIGTAQRVATTADRTNGRVYYISLFAVHRVRWWHRCRGSSVTCFARWWENSSIWDLNPLPQLTQKMTGAEGSGRPWRRLWSFWYFCCIFSSMWLFPLCMACLHCCRSCARVSQWSTVMCVAFRCRLTTSLYRSRCPPRRRFPSVNSP